MLLRYVLLGNEFDPIGRIQTRKPSYESAKKFLGVGHERKNMLVRSYLRYGNPSQVGSRKMKGRIFCLRCEFCASKLSERRKQE